MGQSAKVVSGSQSQPDPGYRPGNAENVVFISSPVSESVGTRELLSGCYKLHTTPWIYPLPSLVLDPIQSIRNVNHESVYSLLCCGM